MASLSVWKHVVTMILYLPVLETCVLSDLTSLEISGDRSQRASFIDVVMFQAEGVALKPSLRDLAAQLEAYETAWRSEPIDSSSKWRDNLGVKMDSRVPDGVIFSDASACHRTETDMVLSSTDPDSSSPAQAQGFSHGTQSAMDAVRDSPKVPEDSAASEQASEPPHDSDNQQLEQPTAPVISRSLIEIIKSSESLQSPSQRPNTNTLGDTTGSSYSTFANGIALATPPLISDDHNMSYKTKRLSPPRGGPEGSSIGTGSQGNIIAAEVEDLSGLSRAMTALSIQAIPSPVFKLLEQKNAASWAQDLEHDLDSITLKHYSNKNTSVKPREGLSIKAKNSETGDWATQVNWHLEKVFRKHQNEL